MKKQADTKTLKLLFNSLCMKLGGFNLTEYEEMTIFDFYYDQYTFTMKLKDNNITLADNVDVYDEHEQFIGNYTLKEVFEQGIEEA